MKIAVISNPRHRDGDMMEYMLHRAVFAFYKFVPVDLVIVTGELTAGNRPAETGFLSVFFGTLEKRKVDLPILWMTAPSGVALPEPPAEVAAGGSRERPAALLERIRRAAGELPDFDRPPFEAAVAAVAADGSIRVERCAMTVPAVPGVTDFHVHTPMAYCSENMDIPKALEMARLSNVETLSFSEHSGQLYFRVEDYWPGRGVWRTRDTPEGAAVHSRIADYAETLRRGEAAGKFLHGFELDVDHNGDVVLDGDGRKLAQVRLGAVHHLSRRDDFEAAKREFLFCTESLLRYGAHILAHPFRIFPWAKLPKPPELYEPVAELLKRYGVAAEINYHFNDPEPEFFELCLKKGVKLSLGSDSHSLYEVGFFLPHFRLLRELGVSGRLDEVLYRFPEKPGTRPCQL